MAYDGWPDVRGGCPVCKAAGCATYRGYYVRLMFCPELEIPPGPEFKGRALKGMYTALLNLNHVTVLLTPFIPSSAERALNMLGGKGSKAVFLELANIEFHPRNPFTIIVFKNGFYFGFV
ncbi:MAG: hypothetical protein HC902_14935 [Calothrix sp. SM1_5_4]|nr:hypothetical protein [Calothrix sp. SM1_5_4]